MNYFIQIKGTRQNKGYPQHQEAAALSFQSHIPEEAPLLEKTLLIGLHRAGGEQYRGQCGSGPRLTLSPPPCPTAGSANG